MGFLVPVFTNVMMDNSDHDWARRTVPLSRDEVVLWVRMASESSHRMGRYGGGLGSSWAVTTLTP